MSKNYLNMVHNEGQELVVIKNKGIIDNGRFIPSEVLGIVLYPIDSSKIKRNENGEKELKANITYVDAGLLVFITLFLQTLFKIIKGEKPIKGSLGKHSLLNSKKMTCVCSACSIKEEKRLIKYTIVAIAILAISIFTL